MRGYQNILYIHLIPGTQITEETYREWTENLIHVLRKKIWEKEKTELRFGVSSWKDGFEKMGEALKESRIAVPAVCEACNHLRKSKRRGETGGFFRRVRRRDGSSFPERGDGKDQRSAAGKNCLNPEGMLAQRADQMEAVSFLIEIYKCLQERQELDVFCQFSYPDI